MEAEHVHKWEHVSVTKVACTGCDVTVSSVDRLRVEQEHREWQAQQAAKAVEKLT